jgi:hypothetical protein
MLQVELERINQFLKHSKLRLQEFEQHRIDYADTTTQHAEEIQKLNSELVATKAEVVEKEREKNRTVQEMHYLRKIKGKAREMVWRKERQIRRMSAKFLRESSLKDAYIYAHLKHVNQLNSKVSDQYNAMQCTM